MGTAVGKGYRQSAVLLQDPGMARESVPGRLEIAENERLDIGSLTALLQELGLDGTAQETAVVELIERCLSLKYRKQASQQDQKHEPLHLTNLAGRERRWFGVWRDFCCFWQPRGLPFLLLRATKKVAATVAATKKPLRRFGTAWRQDTPEALRRLRLRLRFRLPANSFSRFRCRCRGPIQWRIAGWFRSPGRWSLSG